MPAFSHARALHVRDFSRLTDDFIDERVTKDLVRKVAIDLLKADKTSRRSFKKKLLTMTWNDEMLQHIIIGK